MNSSPVRNNLYLDQYFPTEETAPTPSENLGEESYESFDQEEFLGEDLEVVDEGSSSEVDEEAFGEEEIPEPTYGQKSTMEWLEKHGEDLAEDYSEAQDRLSDLQSGTEDLKPEERRKQLEELDSTLSEIERELKKYSAKEETLREGELPEGYLDFESEIDSESMTDELESIRKDLEGELDTAKTEETEAAEAESKAELKEEEGRALKDKLTDALGYLNGSKDKLYFTAKVWGDKHIKDYHEDVTQYALGLISQMADAAVGGDWSGVVTFVEGLNSGAADNTLGLVGLILSKHAPEVLDKLPSELLEAMADGILRGNDPGDKNIYYIKQDGKYDGPKDDRRRKDMGHEGFAYKEAAEIFQAKAESNRAREKAEAEENGDSSAEGAADEVEN